MDNKYLEIEYREQRTDKRLTEMKRKKTTHTTNLHETRQRQSNQMYEC